MGITIPQEPQTINPAGPPTIRHEPVSQGDPAEFKRFEEFAGQLVQVPKSEIDEKRKAD